jgi:8-oxo-dGTP pyrophosphatase MutT (NUDIX family)
MSAIRRVAEIDYRFKAFDWPFAREDAVVIDAHWARARAEKPGLFDGRVLVARDLLVEDRAGGVLRATAFETGYKAFLAWRDLGFPGAPVFNVFSMCALRSADGAFMLGRMAPGTASAGKLYFPAGTPEPADITDGMVDLRANMLRELEEETGIASDEIALEDGWTLVFDQARVACMKIGQSALAAEALLARFEHFRAGQVDPELDALAPVRSRADFDAARMPAFMLIYLGHVFS